MSSRSQRGDGGGELTVEPQFSRNYRHPYRPEWMLFEVVLDGDAIARCARADGRKQTTVPLASGRHVIEVHSWPDSRHPRALLLRTELTAAPGEAVLVRVFPGSRLPWFKPARIELVARRGS